MWANAKRDGCPVEYRWRPLPNAAKFAVLWPLFWDYPGEPVLEIFLWTLWCNGKITCRIVGVSASVIFPCTIKS